MSVFFETSKALNQVVGIRHGFFARTGGVSKGFYQSLNASTKVGDEAQKVQENRRRALESLSRDLPPPAMPNLMHSNEVLMILKADECLGVEADGVITQTMALPLAITYADCLPILLSTADGAQIAAVHAGWRGILNGVVTKTATLMNAKNLAVYAAIGPYISPERFVVTDEVLQKFTQNYPSFVVASGQMGRVDLGAIAAHQLKEAGVLVVEKVGGHTDQDIAKYFSHRQERGQTGRLFAAIVKINNK
jgi:YfiH family protein